MFLNENELPLIALSVYLCCCYRFALLKKKDRNILHFIAMNDLLLVHSKWCT